MSTAPVISVGIATYNGARFLREQLDSIYSACQVPFEVVVADDGSTDGTREILEEYARTRGLRIVSDGERRGLVKNFEHVLRHCRGDYIALSDQDDVWTPGRLNALLAALGDYDAVYSLLDRVISPDGELTPWVAPDGVREYARLHGTGRPLAHLIACNWVVSHTMLFRREVLAKALPIPPGQAYHDAWLGLAAAAGRGIRYLEPSLTLYRLHAASLTAAGIARGPATRRWLGRSAGLARETWRAKCRAEIARFDECAQATFLPEEAQAMARRFGDYYRRGLRGGLSLRTGLLARRLVPYFYSSINPRWRRNFVLRGFLGAV